MTNCLYALSRIFYGILLIFKYKFKQKKNKHPKYMSVFLFFVFFMNP